MAAPVPAIIKLPDDSAGAGPKIRGQSQVVGANTVFEHYYVQTRQAKILSIYRLALVQNTVLAAAQNGTTAGMLFGHMPSTVSGKAMRLRRLSASSQHSTALATPTAPRLLVRRYTSSGGLSGALLAPNINDSLVHITPACLFSLANTGTTVVHVGIGFGTIGLTGALTAVGAYHPDFIDVIDPGEDEDDWPVFRPGEGFVVYQDVAGTTSDTRKFNLQLVADEIDTA
jgi:hypothetical protein